jgi:hypothetical protein
MERILSAFFAPDVLGLVPLAVVGMFVFLLVRPRKQDASEEFWLALMQQLRGTSSPEQGAGNKPDVPKAEDADQTSDDRSARLFPF